MIYSSNSISFDTISHNEPSSIVIVIASIKINLLNDYDSDLTCYSSVLFIKIAAITRASLIPCIFLKIS
jgi:hypothetical protein